MSTFCNRIELVYSSLEALRHRAGMSAENAALITAALAQLHALGQEIDNQIKDLMGVRRGLTQQNLYYQRLLSLDPNGLIIMDADLLILEANSAAANILKVETLPKLLGETLDSYVAEQGRDAFLESLRRITTGEVALAEAEVWMQGSDGSLVPVSARIVAAESKDEYRLALFMNEVPQYRQEENAALDTWEHFRLLAENVSEVIFTIDRSLHLTFVSPSITPVLGYTEAEATTAGIGGLFTPGSVIRVYSLLEEELEAGKGTGNHLHGCSAVELEMVQKDGSPVWAEVKFRALRSPSTKKHGSGGELLGFLGIATDIRERHRVEEVAREMDERFEHACQESPIIIALYDQDGNLVSTNRTSEDRSGISTDATTKVLSLFDDPLLTKTAKEDLRAGSETRLRCGLDCDRAIVLGLCNANRTAPVDVDMVITPLVRREGGPGGYLAHMQDVTGREMAYQQLQGRYEQEVQLRQAIESEMNKRLEFTRALAHELKTPLTAVLASSTALAANLREGLPLDLARNLVRGAYRLSGRINEFLDLASGELGVLALNKRTIDPTRLLREAAEELSDMVANPEQSLVLEIPNDIPLIWADEERLKQVVLNLLDNARQYPGKGSIITLSAKVEDARLFVEVRDTGRGIPAEEQGRIFESYTPREVGGKRTGGLGMGLPLGKMLIELHGGQIWMRTEEGEGSTFGFWVPVVEGDT